MSVVPTGVVHLGLGAFHRAHQAWVFDQLIRLGDSRWGVLGVAMNNPDTVNALHTQNHRYSVQISDGHKSTFEWIHAVCSSCVAATHRQQVLDAISSPHTRWITLTITEKGYTPAIAQLIIDGLSLRQQLSLPGLTIASCDNLSGNGTLLKKLCLQQAEQHNLKLAHWINMQCAFPNSMVDRIVPQATDACREQAELALGERDQAAIATEPFWEWVIEHRFVEMNDAAALKSVGVQIVDNVALFEDAKLRMLNATHTALAAMGAVVGFHAMSDCVASQPLRDFAHALMTHEVMPLLSRPNLNTYRDHLLQRFANSSLQHKALQICNDNSQKIPLRWVPSIEQRIQSQQSFECFSFAAAAWIRFLQGHTQDHTAYTWSDPMRSQLQILAQQHANNSDDCTAALLSIPSIWGSQLPHHRPWLSAVTQHHQRIQQLGLLQALQETLS